MPSGYGHYLENSAGNISRILLGFNAGRYEQISLSGWLAANPRQLVATNFSLPLTVVEWEQWGNPRDPEHYDYMRRYSPYDNVEKKAYPWLLVTTSLNDSQVMYWEPAKWVAKLRAMKTDSNPLLFKVNMANHDLEELERVVATANARILDDHQKHYTVEFIGGSQDVDRVMERIAAVGELTTVVRGGAMAVARGAPVFGRATK